MDSETIMDFERIVMFKIVKLCHCEAKPILLCCGNLLESTITTMALPRDCHGT